MTARADDPPPEAGKLRPDGSGGPPGSVGWSPGRDSGWRCWDREPSTQPGARGGGAAGANRRARRRAVEQLGRMRGAAMKVGQMISMVEFDGLPEDQRQALQTKLALLRDDVPPVPFAKLERMMRQEFGGPAFARVLGVRRAGVCRRIDRPGPPRRHRRRRGGGREVPVPRGRRGSRDRYAKALTLLPLVKRLAPGLDAKALFSELRERISEELTPAGGSAPAPDRATAPRPSVHLCPARLHRALDRRVLTTEYVAGERFVGRTESAESERDRYGEIVYRFFLGSPDGIGSRSAIPTPATTCCAPTAGSRSSTTACCATSTPSAWTRRGRSRAPSLTGTRPRSSRRWWRAGISPPEGGRGRRRTRAEDDAPRHEVVCGSYRRFGGDEHRRRRHRDGDEHRHGDGTDDHRPANVRDQINQFTLPAETVPTAACTGSSVSSCGSWRGRGLGRDRRRVPAGRTAGVRARRGRSRVLRKLGPRCNLGERGITSDANSWRCDTRSRS